MDGFTRPGPEPEGRKLRAQQAPRTGRKRTPIPRPESRAMRATGRASASALRVPRPGRPRHGRRGRSLHGWIYGVPAWNPKGGSGGRETPSALATPASGRVSARELERAPAPRGPAPRAERASRRALRPAVRRAHARSPSIDGKISTRIVPGIGTIAPFGIERRAPRMTAGTSGTPPRAAATNAPM